jgi:hypothetical protein
MPANAGIHAWSDRAFARVASYGGFRPSESAEAQSAKAKRNAGPHDPGFHGACPRLAEGETRGLHPGYAPATDEIVAHNHSLQTNKKATKFDFWQNSFGKARRVGNRACTSLSAWAKSPMRGCPRGQE